MDTFSLVFLACALSMDAFAVALCKGFSVNELKIKHFLIVGALFGGFQALMLLSGYFLGFALNSFIDDYDHWVAFILLSLIGLKIIKESRQKDNCDTNGDQFGFQTMFLLAMATSIDALAVGVSFAFLYIEIFSSVLIIGVITFIFSALALKIGKKFGTKFKDKAEFIGGVMLICIGAKILLQHLLES